MILELHKVYRCRNGDIARVKEEHSDRTEADNCWQFEVEILFPEVDEAGYSVTKRGMFWEDADATDLHEPNDLIELLSEDEFPEYYL